MIIDPHDSESLGAQAHRQRKYAWNIDEDIPWSSGVRLDLPFLPLDQDCVAFPGASVEQRLALSQFLGLVINSAIAEMENVINRLRYTSWERLLRRYPVNPEIWDLGDLFFEEEIKHCQAFYRYNDAFCEATGINPELLSRILPKVYGSQFLKRIVANSEAGGSAFWWVVAAVEEASMLVYREIHASKTGVDPLFYMVHRRHMEDEARHQNYAFLMLDLVDKEPRSPRRFLRGKTDLALAQGLAASWLMVELHKIFDTKRLATSHEFFAILAGCLPLFEKLSKVEVVRRLVVSAPYVSLMINSAHHPMTLKTAARQGSVGLPFPEARPAVTYA